MQQEKYLFLVNKYLSNTLSEREKQDLSTWLDVDPDLEKILEEIKRCGTTPMHLGKFLHSDTQVGWVSMQNSIGGRPKSWSNLALFNIKKRLSFWKRKLKSIYLFIKPA